MDPLALDGSGRRTSLSRGYALRAPGLTGTVNVFTPTPGQAASRDSAPATPELDAAFRNASVQEAATIALSVRNTAAPAAAPALRSPTGEAALELEVPDLGPEKGQVVLMVGEDGLLTWHFPLAGDGAHVEPPTTRGQGGVKRFRVPNAAAAPPPPGAPAHRGFVALGRKLLKVLVYPVTDPVLGPIGEHFAHRWEEKNRPYRVRRFTPDNYAVAGAPELTPAEWQALAAGPVLLFVHGTFSTSHGCFGGLPRELVVELNQRYQNRVIAFDTFTLSEDPDENARRFLASAPPGLELDLDIVCHSRGGLVTRRIALRGAESGGQVRVRRAVFVGVPNAGTALADPDHMVQMIDRFTSALVLIPTGPVTETMEAILTVVKVLGHAAATGLSGLASMRPDGPFLKGLNGAAAGASDYYAITADYEPRGDTLAALVRAQATDAVMDRVFGGTANDLVVPTTGVFQVEGPSGFRIPDERVLRFDARAGIIHTTYFGAPETARALDSWLQA